MVDYYREHLNLNIPSPIQALADPLFEKAGIQVYAKRDDLIDSEISGNKWRKLKHNIIASNNLPILTFGGAFSNHIAATAAICHRLGRKSIGIVRGEKTDPLNHTLQQAAAYGMVLHFVSRSDYQLKNNAEFIDLLEAKFGEFHLIPEGGANHLGVKGSRDIVNEIDQSFDYMISAIGTGTTLAGMITASTKKQLQMGIPVLKNGGFLKGDIDSMINEYSAKFEQPEPLSPFKLYTDYHHGGYARISDELIKFMRYFHQHHGIKTDPVYSGKSAFALYDLIKRDFFRPGSTVIWLHCGGLQGIEGIEKRYGINVY